MHEIYFNLILMLISYYNNLSYFFYCSTFKLVNPLKFDPLIGILKLLGSLDSYRVEILFNRKKL